VRSIYRMAAHELCDCAGKGSMQPSLLLLLLYCFFVKNVYEITQRVKRKLKGAASFADSPYVFALSEREQSHSYVIEWHSLYIL
jgi:hypothetical protein